MDRVRFACRATVVIRQTSSLVIIVVFALTLTACGSRGRTAATTGTASTASRTASTEAPSTTPGGAAAGAPAPGPSAATGAPSPASDAAAAASSAAPSCPSDQLAAYANRGSGAGGHEAVIVVFRNKGATACTMSGYPSAWFVDADGSRINTTSIQMSGSPPAAKIILQPGGEASTTVWTTNPSVPAPSDCRPGTAVGVQVTPPGQSVSITASISITVCTAGTTAGTTPMVSGATQSGL